MSRHDHALSRRQFARLGAFGVAGLSFGSNATAQQSADGLKSEFLLDMQLDIADAQALGPRQIAPVTGGTFEGPRLKGVALDGGGDWLIRRPDGASELNVRATLQTDDDHLISVWYHGLIFTPAGGDLYWRTTPVFETASDKYGWLNRIIAVGVGRRVPGKAAYSVYQIL